MTLHGPDQVSQQPSSSRTRLLGNWTCRQRETLTQASARTPIHSYIPNATGERASECLNAYVAAGCLERLRCAEVGNE
jgi:hypothetical protein